MEHGYMDYLFVLELYNESIPLERLLFHVEPDGDAPPAARERAERMLEEMAEKGLVGLEYHGAELMIRLTAYGREVSRQVADLLADRMVDDWRLRQLAFGPGGAGAANF